MLWIELAGGISPVIYESARCLKLVPKQHLLARYAMPLKPWALRRLIEQPDKYQHADLIKQCLLDMPSVRWFAWVQRRRLRKMVLRSIQQSIVEKIANERTETTI